MRRKILALLLSCTLLTSFMLTASAQRQAQDGTDNQQTEQALDDFDLTDYDDISIEEPINADANEVTIGGSGVQANTPSTYAAGQFTTPTFLWNDSLTADDPIDFYFFSLTSARDIWFNIDSLNENTVVMFCLVDWSSGTINPTDVYTYPKNGMKGLRSVPAGDYALYVLTTDNSTSNYKVMYNGTTIPGATGLLHYSDDLSIMFFRYPGDIVRWNGDEINIHPYVHYSDAIPGTSYTYDVKGEADAAVLGSFYSTNFKSDYVIYYQMPVGTQFYTRWGSGNTTDIRGLHTPRQFDQFDIVCEYEGGEGDGPQYVIYDLITGKFVAFPSVLNIAYQTGGQKVEYWNCKSYATLYGDPKASTRKPR